MAYWRDEADDDEAQGGCEWLRAALYAGAALLAAAAAWRVLV